MDRDRQLAESFSEIDSRICALESSIRKPENSLDIDGLLAQSADIVGDLMRAYAHHGGKSVPISDDLLQVFRAFAKGDPSLNAIRDNVRELVYYRNCLDMDRGDALPVRPAHMAVRTARHVYLYLYTRSIQEQRLP